MRTGRDEALNLFSKWMEEGTVLQCAFSFRLFAASLRAKVRSVAPTELRLVSSDTLSELVVRLEDSMEFGYGEGPEGVARFAGLVLFFRLADTDEETEFISFTERTD